MKKALIFLKLVISFSILILIFSISGPVIYKLNQQLLFSGKNQNYDNQIMFALNKMYFEIKCCQKIINTLDHPTESKMLSILSAEGEQITYSIKNSRLARRTGGTFYLTPRDLKLKDLKIERSTDLIKLSFTAEKKQYQRNFYRSVRLINV